MVPKQLGKKCGGKCEVLGQDSMYQAAGHAAFICDKLVPEYPCIWNDYSM